MEKNSYPSLSTDTINDDTQPRLPRQGVNNSPMNHIQSYQERAARSAMIYEEQTRPLSDGTGAYQQNRLAARQGQDQPFQSSGGQARTYVVTPHAPVVAQTRSQSTPDASMQQPRKGSKSAPRMAKEQALRITRGLKKGVVVASVLSLGTFAALAEIHTLNTPVVQAAPRQHSSSKSTGASKSTGPVLGPPNAASATPTQAVATPANSTGSSSTSQSGGTNDQNGNGGFNFGSGNSQGPATGSGVS